MDQMRNINQTSMYRYLFASIIRLAKYYATRNLHMKNKMHINYEALCCD